MSSTRIGKGKDYYVCALWRVTRLLPLHFVRDHAMAHCQAPMARGRPLRARGLVGMVWY
jgi:hypothetical protein